MSVMVIDRLAERNKQKLKTNYIMSAQNTSVITKTVTVTEKVVTISAKWYGGRWNRWKLAVEGEDFSYTTQLYYKTVSPREVGIYASSSWSGAQERKVSVSSLIADLQGKRGNLGDLRKSLEKYVA